MTATSHFTVDTNILIYSVDRSDPAKQFIADKVIRALYAKRAKLPLQCLSEFYRATTRKRILSPIEATEFVQDALIFTDSVSATSEDLSEAMRLHQTGEFQFFDALLITTAVRASCTTLFSEDLQNGRTLGSLAIHNPFIMNETELNALIG
ncbi:PIN domain-containing protein [Granulicella mallensis]|uniref:Putative nucleic acid-binding protein n=1 Tax=Granulicella mallensis TaxID=940614 RepID=A0A7W7ZRR4_9BACT|nr:PIN domain-containing protein [Granulicella mallensis]MBB5064883.1 putative nucleic acid-binding protein [Granulicella mallensis]